MADLARLPAQAYVYVVGAVDGPQKIGVAGDPQGRLRMLQNGNPADLRVAATVPASRDMAFEIERYAHWLLRDDRIRGEWFDVSPEGAKIALAEAAEAVASGARAPRAPDNHNPALGLKSQPWQMRAQAAGLEQKTLARLLGRPVNTISRQIRGLHGGVPQHLVAVIVVWEMLSPRQREDWIASVVKEFAPPRRERTPKPKGPEG